MATKSFDCSALMKYVIVGGLLGTGIVFFSLNESREEWPIPEIIVTHSIVPFDSRNHVWKLFASSEHNFDQLLYNTEGYVMKAGEFHDRGLSDIEVLQASLGCYPKFLLQEDSSDLKVELTNHQALVNAQALAAATSITLTSTIAELAVNDHLRIVNPDGKVEIVKVTVITAAPTYTVTRSNAPAGFSTGPAMDIQANVQATRIALIPQLKYPYSMQAITTTSLTVPSNNFADEPLSVCKCLADVNKIVKAFKADTSADSKSKKDTWAAKIASEAGWGNEEKGIHKDTRQKEAGERFYEDLKDKNAAVFKRRAVDSCIANYVPKYTQSYDGILDSRHMLRFSQILMVIGILIIAASTQYKMKSEALEFMEGVSAWIPGGIHVLIVAATILAFWFNLWFSGETRTVSSEPKLGMDHNAAEILKFRPYSFANPDELAISNVYHWVIGIVLALLCFASGIRGLILAGFIKTTGYLKMLENQVFRRVLIDLPFIVGYAGMGMALIAQSGVQDTTSILFTGVLLFVAGLFQHLSNVSKLMYDSLCINTSHDSMDKIFRKDVTAKNATDTLHFFGWTRLMIFASVLLASVAYLTMTREVVESNVVQAFMNGQLFYFILAFFWSNVGYDIVRELVPFTFEHEGSLNYAKMSITLGYLIYYNINLYWLQDAVYDSGEFSEYALHDGYKI